MGQLWVPVGNVRRLKSERWKFFSWVEFTQNYLLSQRHDDLAKIWETLVDCLGRKCGWYWGSTKPNSTCASVSLTPSLPLSLILSLPARSTWIESSLFHSITRAKTIKWRQHKPGSKHHSRSPVWKCCGLQSSKWTHCGFESSSRCTESWPEHSRLRWQLSCRIAWGAKNVGLPNTVIDICSKTWPEPSSCRLVASCPPHELHSQPGGTF